MKPNNDPKEHPTAYRKLIAVDFLDLQEGHTLINPNALNISPQLERL